MIIIIVTQTQVTTTVVECMNIETQGDGQGKINEVKFIILKKEDEPRVESGWSVLPRRSRHSSYAVIDLISFSASANSSSFNVSSQSLSSLALPSEVYIKGLNLDSIIRKRLH